MAIITLRLNEEEQKALDLMVQFFDEDRSKILKEAMWEKFEDIRDREIIEDFEKKESQGKVVFEDASEFVSQLEASNRHSSKRVTSPSRRTAISRRRRT